MQADLAVPGNSYLYRFSVGDLPATMVSDGLLLAGPPTPNFIKNITTEEVLSIYDANFVRKDEWLLEQNVLVVNTGGKTILFDTGLGSIPGFGPVCGQLMETLAAAKIDPAAIDAVVLSHSHFDHAGGIMRDDGTRNFPNAQYYINEADFKFWTDPSKPSNILTDTARRNLLPNQDRMVFVSDGQEFLTGVTAILAPGHSVGHMMFMVHSGKDRLCLMNDLAHDSVVMLERPLVHLAADTDPEQSAQTRLKSLTMLADERIQALGYHFPWPGIGHIARFGDGFRFVPSPMEMMKAD